MRFVQPAWKRRSITRASPSKSRLVWHLDLTSGSERILTAESIYPDVPRLVVLVLAIVLFAGVVIIRSRGQRRNTPEPPIFTTPSQP